MKTYKIHLIRHGTCEGSLLSKYIGRTESPLAIEGIKELAKLKSEHDFPYAKDFYASPSTRCVDSLKILYPDAEPTVIFEMAECDFGDWEDKNADELKEDPRFIEWINGGNSVSPPNGESFSVFMQRVCKGFETLVNNMMFTGQTDVVLVTHGGVIMTILAAYGLPQAKMTDWICESGNGYSIRLDTGLWSRSHVCEVYSQIPPTQKKESNDYSIIDIAREAAANSLYENKE